MEYRRLGSSDLRVSVIGLGTWLTFDQGVDRERSEACVRRALEVGINFFDTANVYGRGAAESFLGEVLASVDRDSYVLATKLYWPMSRTDRGLSAPQVRKQIDASLKRLRTDHVDLYQCHRYDPDTPLEETMEALSEVVRQGKARYIGFSEWTADQIRASVDLAEKHGFVRFASSQPQYSMLARRWETEIFDLCRQEGIGQVVWSPLAQGVLTGKYRPGAPPPPDSRAASEHMGTSMGRLRDDALLAAVQDLRPVAEDAGVSLAQLALAWVLRDPIVASALVGATRPEQVEANAGAAGVRLDDGVLEEIERVLAPVL